MMRVIAALVLAPVLAVPLAGCGLQPMYAGGGSSAVARGLTGIQVSAIEGRAGWLVRNALNDKLMQGSEVARYRLDVRLDDHLDAFGLLRDDTVARERRTLRARYQLVEQASGTVVLDATTRADAGIDVVSSDFATIAGEQTALENLARDVADRIVTNVALQLRKGAAARP
jgi:LPS-assembly lipoprotein